MGIEEELETDAAGNVITRPILGCIVSPLGGMAILLQVQYAEKPEELKTGGRSLKPSDSVSRIGDSASVQAATRVNAEQASKRSMCRPTRQPFRGRLIRVGEMSEEYAQPLHRGSGGSMYTRKAHATREAPRRGQG